MAERGRPTPSDARPAQIDGEFNWSMQHTRRCV